MSIQAPLRRIFQKRGKLPRLAINLSGAMVAALCLVLAACVAWAFFMGFLVGKGQNPKASIENMTGIALTDENTATGENPQVAEKTPQADTGDEKPMQAAPALPFSRPEEKARGAWAEEGSSEIPEVRKQPKKDKPRPAPKKTAAADDGKVFNYNYQVAAYRSSVDAIKLRESLKKAGINGTVQKSGKVHLVTVAFKGTESTAAKLRARLENLKLGAPLLLSKKPLEKAGRARSSK